MGNISKETLYKIKQQRIVPHPKGYFLLKHTTVWGLFGLSIILGSIACSAAIFQLKNAEWDLFRHFRHSILEFVWLVMPYFWLLFLVGFSIIAYYYFRRTQSGYRYRTTTVVALSILLSLFGGWGLYASGFSERMESVFEDTLPFYRGVTAHRRMVWMSPDKGLLAGKIVDVTKDDMIRLKDLDGKIWRVDITGTTWRGRLMPSPNLEIKLIGNRTGQNSFAAQEVRPWRGRRKHGGKRHRNIP